MADYSKRPADSNTDFRTNKNKMEFSKKWLISVIAISCIFTIASYVLAFFDKNPVSEIAVAIIQTLWGTSGVSFVSYAVQNSVRAYTSTKILGIELEEQKLQNEINNENSEFDQNNLYNNDGGDDYDYR